MMRVTDVVCTQIGSRSGSNLIAGEHPANISSAGHCVNDHMCSEHSRHMQLSSPHLLVQI